MHAKTSGKRLLARCLSLSAIATGLLLAACSAPGKGALIMAISTDMQAPKDISTVSIFVSEGAVVKFDYVGVVTPLGTVTLPSTLALVEPDDPSTQIQIRVIGYNGQTARVLRDIQTTVPHQRTALLHVPLDFIDLNSVPSNPPQMLPDMYYPLSTTDSVAEGISNFDPDTITSTCDPDLMCKTGGPCLTTINGTCQSAVVPSEQLPDYQDSLVFGSGGNASNQNCFDVQSCFAGATAVNDVTFNGANGACTFPLPVVGGGSASATDAGGEAADGGIAPNDASAMASDAATPQSSSGSSSGSGSGEAITDSGGVSGGSTGGSGEISCGTSVCIAESQVCCSVNTQTVCLTAAQCAAAQQQIKDAGAAPDGAVQSVDVTLSAPIDAGASVDNMADGAVSQGSGAPSGSQGTSQGTTGASSSSTSTLNFAMVTATTGACIAQGCFVPIENDPNEGWSVNGNTVTLAAGLCNQLMAQSARLFVVDDVTCPTKTESQPVCEPTGAGDDGGSSSVEDAGAGSPIDAAIATRDTGTMSGMTGGNEGDAEAFTGPDATVAPQDGGTGGFGGFTDASTTVDASSVLTGIAAIAAGPVTTCAVTANGTVDCWGLVVSTGTATPEPLPGFNAVTKGAVGGTQTGEFTCVLTSSGQPLCEGMGVLDPFEGGTGEGSAPFPVVGVSGATSIGAGTAFACALSLGSGTVQCWGDNTYGQLGNPDISETSSSTPVTVALAGQAADLAVGSDFACALLQGSTVQCWGDNAGGILGSDEAGTSSSEPVTVTGFQGAVLSNIVAGQAHVCALAEAGSVYCWGDNSLLQLGPIGSTVPSSSTPLEGVISTATALAAGGNETCIIVQGGKVECWGSNDQGQLGVPSSATPMSSGAVATGVANATAIAVGGEHACALLQGGTVECWGYDVDGEIGTGSASPIDVVPSTLVVGAGSGLPASDGGPAP